ncbi:uncharacterized protein BX664DRAFT_322343, partial [Halteromyces radiatus]|uniref:uncharacterized protein n=1 Tax=Halteromyces radiatus TaxID=101107 RepID=UPI00221E4573
MTSLLLLPSEIIDLICSFLSKNDFLTCLCVSSSWHDFFIHHLHKHISIRGDKQLEQVCQSLLRHAPRYLGHSVRTLRLSIKNIKDRHLSQLAAWCTHIETLFLRWSIWFEEEIKVLPLQETAEERELKELRYTDIMASFIGPFLNLSQLTLDVSFGVRDIKIPDFLPFLPRLTILMITVGNRLSFDYIELIHKQCPSLQRLTLQGLFIENIPAITPTKLSWSDNNTSSTSSSSPITITPAEHLAIIKLEFVSGDTEYYLDWMMYFAKKYPNLMSFAFHQHTASLSPYLASATGQQLNHPFYQYVFSTLSQQCPHLSAAHLKNIHINPEFFKQVGSKLDHLAIHLPDTSPLGLSTHSTNTSPNLYYFSSLFQHTEMQQHLSSLRLSLPVKDNTNTPLLPNQIVTQLHHFHHLASLTIHWSQSLACFHLDSLLSSLPQLMNLTLVSMKVGLLQQQESTLDKRHPLQSLTLWSVIMIDPHHLFNWINSYVDLSHLKLTHSCRSISSLDHDKQIPNNIWLPDTRLKTFSIHERYHQSNPIRLYMLHQTAVRTGKQQDDYRPRFSHLTDQHDNKDDKFAWYFLKYFDNETASSSQLVQLDADQNFEWVVPFYQVKKNCPWYADLCDIADDVYKKHNLEHDLVDDIDGIDYMNIVCRSITYLKINDERISFF